MPYKFKRRRRSWRKLHLGLDLVSGEIICADLTTETVGNPEASADLLEQIDNSVEWFIVDGAYDGTATRELLTKLGETLKIAMPPPKTAVLSTNSAHEPTDRDRGISFIAENGRLAWQNISGYNQRSRLETQTGRLKQVIGSKLKARSFENQETEIKLVFGFLTK